MSLDNLVCVSLLVQDEYPFTQCHYPRSKEFAVSECRVEANRRLLKLTDHLDSENPHYVIIRKQKRELIFIYRNTTFHTRTR